MQNELSKKEKWIFIIPVIILLLYLILRLIDKSFIIWNFPFDRANDISSHMAKLYFLAEYGFHSVIPNWYTGLNYTLFRSYPPGWYFLTLPLYYLFENVQIATYTSLILIYLCSFLIMYQIGKANSFSLIKRLAFFVFFLANPIAIGFLLRLGRMPELTGWVFGLLTLAILLYYKDKKLDNKFFILSIILAAWALTNLTSFVPSTTLIIGFFLYKNKKFKIAIILCGFIAILLSLFWLYPFILRMFLGTYADTYFSQILVSEGISIDKITTWVSSLILFISFFFYWLNENKPKKELIFYLPILILGFLVFTRLIIFIPLYNHVHPDNFNMLFILIASFLFLSTKFNKKRWRLIAILLILFVGLGTIISVFYTQGEIPNTESDKITLELIQLTKGITIISHNPDSYNRAFYSYSAIFYNKTFISGWDDVDTPHKTIKRMKTKLHIPSNSNDCLNYINELNYFNINSIITYDNYCENLKECGFNLIKQKKGVCLYDNPLVNP